MSELDLRERREREEVRRAEEEPLFPPTPSFMASAVVEEGEATHSFVLSFVFCL